MPSDAATRLPPSFLASRTPSPGPRAPQCSSGQSSTPRCNPQLPHRSCRSRAVSCLNELTLQRVESSCVRASGPQLSGALPLPHLADSVWPEHLQASDVGQPAAGFDELLPATPIPLQAACPVCCKRCPALPIHRHFGVAAGVLCSAHALPPRSDPPACIKHPKGKAPRGHPD